MPIPVVIDCDPGVDDAVNLFMAFSRPDVIDILGITTVSGNVPVTLTSRNACLLREIAQREDVPIYAGCSRPLFVEAQFAEEVHGESGIQGLAVREPRNPAGAEHAVDFIINTLLASPEDSVTLAPTGPLTNIALAIAKEPRILRQIDKIVLMGGAYREGGNVTPSAEFNIWADPHAADIVFRCGRPIVALGLDVTHKIIVSPAILRRIAALGNAVSQASVDMLTGYNDFEIAKYGVEGGFLHDACTMAYLISPDLFRTRTCSVAVETQSALTRGHTAVDFWRATEKGGSVDWACEVDADGVLELLIDCLARY
jgi:purine nucleosidase